MKRLARTVRGVGTPQHEVIINGGLEAWIYPNRRVGRPTYLWVEEALKDLWENIRNRNREWLHQKLDIGK